MDLVEVEKEVQMQGRHSWGHEDEKVGGARVGEKSV